MPTRSVTINALAITDFKPEKKQLTCYTTCSKGTYIRSLGRDMAKACGSLGYLSALRRTQHGIFIEKEIITLEKLEEIVHNGELDKVMLPVSTVLDDIPAVDIDLDTADKLRMGQKVTHDMAIIHHDVMRAMCNVQLVALVKWVDGYIKPVRVFNH